MKKTKLMAFQASPRLQEMVQEIMDRKGYSTATGVVVQGIIDLHKSIFPAYIMEKKPRMTPKEKAHEQDEEREEKKIIAQEKLTQLCTKLGGTVSEDAGGTNICTYFTYTNTKRYEQEVPIDMLSDDLVKTQFQPSRTKVEQLQKAKKVDY